jgi:uncharacterized protein (DUF433 family)
VSFGKHGTYCWNSFWNQFQHLEPFLNGVLTGKTKFIYHNKSRIFKLNYLDNTMSNQLITISPDILGGTPVFYNTRVPVKNLFDYLKGGDSLEDFLIDFPSVSHQQVIQVLSLAESILTIKPPQDEVAAR